ncbi:MULTISPECIES: tRNA guanosine(34) transglycosylase Tgt [unclassified Minwuia]|jgi:queuine tRNA-ribosyltransferase|uniref:tRNA guanosine(34) transglycosylase Tgt n=1 Tax=unclassified Minwuia TaxID=2618799 RepID=UPI002478DB71|nr:MULTISPECIES: tRNA guanosine(34) transglycosylase Tgt [unclassified Minwuia]
MNAPTFGMDVQATDGMARAGVLQTAHGPIQTPVFMPVGTAGTVKAMTPAAVKQTGATIILGNTYHLMLRPGSELVQEMGGLHRFMNWPGPILTDSGGFQVMSLAGLRKIDADGVTFRSHVDGAHVRLTPESSTLIQDQLDATITMAFDECTPWPATEQQARESMELSMRWAERCRTAFRARPGYGQFGIVQGGTFETLRLQSASTLTDIGFDGYAVGGLAVGEGQEEMFRTLDFTTPALPHDRPRYLMGVGKPDDLVGAVQRGVDMFDCVAPTRSGRNGQAFTRRGTVNLRNSRHRSDPRPLDEECPCPACQDHSRAYLHHLIKAKEILAAMLLTWHNLTYYQTLMQQMRTAILAGRMDNMAAAFSEEQAMGDIPPRD